VATSHRPGAACEAPSRRVDKLRQSVSARQRKRVGMKNREARGATEDSCGSQRRRFFGAPQALRVPSDAPPREPTILATATCATTEFTRLNFSTTRCAMPARSSNTKALSKPAPLEGRVAIIHRRPSEMGQGGAGRC